MAYNPNKTRTWNRNTPNDGEIFDDEFDRIYGNFEYFKTEVPEFDGGIKVDSINEKTSGHGVDIAGVLIKHSDIEANEVECDEVEANEIDANEIETNVVRTDSIVEKTGSHGVDIEGVNLKDGFIKATKGRNVTASYFHPDTTTRNDLFDFLSPYISNINDNVIVSGALITPSPSRQIFIVNKATRTLTYRIILETIYMAFDSEGKVFNMGTTSMGIDNGDSASISFISISI